MPVLDEFYTWAERDRKRSEHTMRRYRATLSQLTDPIGASVTDIEAWWATRFDLSESTRANELACLRTFYRWATRFGHRADDPTRRLDAPKVPNHVPRPIGATDLGRLLGSLTEEAPDLRRAIALGAYGGLRVSEAASLDWRDVDLEARRIYVRGKGRKERAVALSGVLLDLLLPETTGNVVTAGAKPYSGATLQRKVNRLIERHGIAHTFHDLRKRGASLALSKGLNPVAVQQMFGWSSMQTVTHYAAVGDEELDRIAAAMV
jgi:site-specific recombinase XerD